jgi:hypothetical protein
VIVVAVVVSKEEQMVNRQKVVVEPTCSTVANARWCSSELASTVTNQIVTGLDMFEKC